MRTIVVSLFSLGLVLPSTVHAQGQCNLETLKGRFVFTGRGFIEAVQPGIQRMHYGFFEFDGAGKLVGKQSSSRGGKIGREQLSGSYTVDADCIGKITLGRVDGFDQDEAECERDERAKVACGLLASERDALESFELADRLLDTCPCLVERFRKVHRPVDCV